MGALKVVGISTETPENGSWLRLKVQAGLKRAFFVVVFVGWVLGTVVVFDGWEGWLQGDRVEGYVLLARRPFICSFTVKYCCTSIGVVVYRRYYCRFVFISDGDGSRAMF